MLRQRDRRLNMASIVTASANIPLRTYRDHIPAGKVLALQVGLSVVYLTQDDVDTLIPELAEFATEEGYA
jgi:hypothetical protein